MNRKNLTAAVLAGLAGAAGIVGTAQAVNINPDGLGQVLLYPYYTTNGGNMTLLSVVNTSDDAKAVKVRFLEGQNSREVLDFNLYMSKYDVWTASIKNDAEGTPTLRTADTSCTVPYIYGYGGKQAFLPWALDDAGYNDKSYLGKISGEFDDVAVRGAEGHFEMIEMGTLINEKTLDNPLWVDTKTYPECFGPVLPGHPAECFVKRPWTSSELKQPQFLTTYGSAAAATHKDGVPKDCEQLVDAWTDSTDPKLVGYWIDTDGMADIAPPSGGLFGGASVVNVQAGTMYSYDATAIDGFWAVDPPHSIEGVSDFSHQEPGTILPSLDSGGNPFATVFLNGVAYDSGHLNRGVDAVSFVLMHDQLMNEYTTEAVVGAGTEWVITFPTKQFYTHQAFLDDYADFRDVDAPDVPLAPFMSEWYWVNSTYNTDGSVKKAGYVHLPCEVVQLDLIWDREEQTPIDPDDPDVTVPPIVSPRPPEPVVTPDKVIPFELCYETSVIRFGDEDDAGDATEILGSMNFHNIDNEALGYEYGWARLNLSDASYDAKPYGSIDTFHREDLLGNAEGTEGSLFGLPVTGFAVQAFVNAFLGEGADVLANYGGIFDHKYTRSMTSAGD